MSVAMKLVGPCNGEPSPFDGQYRREFDPSNSDLRHLNAPQRPTTCWLITTPNIAEGQTLPVDHGGRGGMGTRRQAPPDTTGR
jgi:hypothetical protein